MTTYTITDPTTNKSVDLEGDHPPTPDDIDEIFSRIHPSPISRLGDWVKETAAAAMPRTAEALKGNGNPLSDAAAPVLDIGSGVAHAIGSVADNTVGRFDRAIKPEITKGMNWLDNGNRTTPLSNVTDAVKKLGVPSKAVDAVENILDQPSNLLLAGIPKAAALLGDVSKIADAGKDAKLGEGTMRLALDPSKKNLNAGFDLHNLNENNIPAALTKKATLDKLENFHNALENKSSAIVAKIPKVDLQAPISEAEKTFQAAFDEGKLLDYKDDIEKALKTWNQRALDLSANKPTAVSGLDELAVDGTKARGFRSSLGSASKYDKSNPSGTTGTQIAAREIRDNLNNQFSELSPEFRAIDKQFAQTIPIRNAIADKLKMEGNKFPLSFRSTLALVSHASPITKAAEIGALELPRNFTVGAGLNKIARATAPARASLDIAKPGAVIVQRLQDIIDNPSSPEQKAAAEKALARIQGTP